MDEKQKADRVAHLERLIRTAALTIHKKGSLPVLAKKAGYTHAALTGAIRRGYLTPGMAAAIECAVGKDVLAKELLLKQE